ncbi:MAG: nitrous oxide reductase family maturation protein NosD [Anaerolineae bacterium]|nr:nitrous oxide reductase family maturation protein NosD [Anaerolineae bacterium]
MKKSVTLIGIDNPVIDGGGEGTIVIISADDAVFRGFTIRNTGQNNSHEDSGIVVEAERVIIEDNLLENVLFGIYFANAHDSVARNNIVRGYDIDLARRGDGMRVWFSHNMLLENNDISSSRDMLIWYADDITIINNRFYNNRYGLHFMYSNNAYIEGNQFMNNSVGTYLMYSNGLRVIGNNLSYNRGPSGYGLALKDMDGVVANDNWFIGNRAGLYIDNSPSLYEGYNEFYNNAFAYNDIGIAAQPHIVRNHFYSNAFLENAQQASTRGRGTLQANSWSIEGVGNYWSDYAGYDADENLIGDMPYRAEGLFEDLADTYPELRFFIYSPAAQAVDMAASAFPSLRPEPKLIDDAPLITIPLPDAAILLQTQSESSLLFPSLLLILFGTLPFWSLFYQRYQSLKIGTKGLVS